MLAQAWWVEDCSQKPGVSGQYVAGWAGARKGDGHGCWPFCAAAAAQGQAEAAEVTVMCAPGWRQTPASDRSQGQLPKGTLSPGSRCMWATCDGCEMQSPCAGWDCPCCLKLPRKREMARGVTFWEHELGSEHPEHRHWSCTACLPLLLLCNLPVP